MIYRDPRTAKREQKSQGVQMLMIFSLILLLIQLWLITIALEAHLAAHSELALPTFAASGFCFVLNLWVLHYLNAVDGEEDD